jgi:hypothetical protein
MRQVPLAVCRAFMISSIIGVLVGAESARAQESPAEPAAREAPGSATQEQIEELARQVEILAEEVERLRSGEPETEVSDDTARQLGLGSSAASVYRRTEGVSIAGYGEMVAEMFSDRNEAGESVSKGSQLDFLRAVFYFGYRFNEKFLFNSEIEIEHADEISVEFAYIDYLAHPALTVRGGMLLVPMGLTNEFHEPTAFLSAKRPETESKLIPSTWRENGFGAVGARGRVSYRAYLVNGFDAAGFSADGVRGGRQKGSKAKASDLGFVGRIDVTPTPGVFVGGSVYFGDSSQGQFETGGQEFSVGTTIGEVHAQAQVRGFDVRALYARSSLDNVDRLNTARGLTGADGIGEAQQGGYVQFGYNVLSQVRERMDLTPFYRFEALNTHSRVAAGFAKNPAVDRTFNTLGVSFRPIPNVAVKVDYQVIRNEAQTGLNQFNIALGYSF